jgi:hypothetical protein
MKKVLLLAMAGLILVSAAIFFPVTLRAHDVAECYRDHEVCREHAMNMDAPWVKVALALTVCDIALGKCILAVKV